MDKAGWEKKLQSKGLPVTLDNNVLMCKTDNIDDAQKFKKAIKDYPCSWGIKRLRGAGEISEEEEEDDG